MVLPQALAARRNRGGGRENYDNYLPGLASQSRPDPGHMHYTSTQLWENELSCLLWYLHLALIITSLVHRASFIHYTIMYEPTQR